MHPSNKFFLRPEFESEQTHVAKTLLLQSLQDNNFSQQYQVSVSYNSETRQLDMGELLHEIFFQILNPNYQYQVFYFSSLNGCFCFGDVYPWTRKFILGEEFILKEEIFVAFRKVSMVDGHSKQSEIAVAQESKKKRRINDRTILQTLQKVSLWRSKCQQQKITFQQAAKQIDIPKKTLDDYYALIRTGEEHGFNFQKNYHQKIGVLRQFVKEKQKENHSSKDKKKTTKSLNLSLLQKEEKPVFAQRKMSIIDRMMLEDDSKGQCKEKQE